MPSVTPTDERKPKMSARSFTRRLRTAGLAALAVAAVATPLVLTGSASGEPSATGAANAVEARIRAVTARYHAVDRAIADGFIPSEECAAIPGIGGMGYHYVNMGRLLDGVVDPDRPDILLYTKDAAGRLRLAGVEWFAADPDQDLSTDEGRPTLLGQPFDGPMPGHEPGMPVHFDLHAWVWETNPAGTFMPWNPAITCA